MKQRPDIVLKAPRPASRAKLRERLAVGRGGDLADHFVACAKLGRYLTLQDTGRFVITDDFAANTTLRPEATAIASVYSRDVLVARAALVPLGRNGAMGDVRRREKYEQLFSLIEAQALNDEVRTVAHDVLASGFQKAYIEELEAELGIETSAARLRYRAFLEIVADVMKGRVSPGVFLDEFLDFTYAVAGRLDFGIYSFCLDRIFASDKISMKIKKMLVIELLKYPPLIRRELLSNILVNPMAGNVLVPFVRHVVANTLDRANAVEIELLEGVKSRRLSMADIEQGLQANIGAGASAGTSARA